MLLRSQKKEKIRAEKPNKRGKKPKKTNEGKTKKAPRYRGKSRRDREKGTFNHDNREEKWKESGTNTEEARSVWIPAGTAPLAIFRQNKIEHGPHWATWKDLGGGTLGRGQGKRWVAGADLVCAPRKGARREKGTAGLSRVPKEGKERRVREERLPGGLRNAKRLGF